MEPLEFEYPQDFQDEVEPEVTPEPPLFKASAVIYVAAALYLFTGFLIPMGDILTRYSPSPETMPDTIIEMLEWNAFSQVGVFLVINGLILFLLGIQVDRRGA